MGINVTGYEEVDNELDLTCEIDQGRIYQSERELLKDLKLDADTV